MQKITAGSILLTVVLALGACGSGEETENMMDEDMMDEETMEDNMSEQEMMGEDSEGHMNHSSSGEVPEDLQEAESPEFEEGSRAIIEAGHMEGMEGAEAVIEGAYDTTAYAVSYTPENGGDPVENHKWVIHEELEDPGEAPLQPGETAVMNTDHMEGMMGTEAEVDSAENTTVYMITFTPTNGGEEVSNHKWVTGAELSETEE
ncbi:uncharacterized protein DUF1541 [Sinobaca qinghaiensis]|uniref:Uncharacterized protein DUF1541 n=1 Tax=Sinobaca qinghaiensis TaxID=342944 RepID=A0A419V8X1_9BACL|nr:YdhK family protein [Sinobaca qinghaiensis]RKD76418.1 uncharacterized protein DUF1541 [Sinobaca qinghaiensis]